MSTPLLGEMLAMWKTVTTTADGFLDNLTTERLQSDLPVDGKLVGQTLSSALLRGTDQYWYHTGEAQAIRQMLLHKDLPEDVGDIVSEAPDRPE